MALLLSLVALFGRFGGKVLTKTLDWAGALLLGGSPERGTSC